MGTVSIIIPAYNAQATLAQALTAVCGSIVPGVEIIVIDDGSTDHTAVVSRQFPVKLLQLTVNSGPAHARNLGARMATGELLVFLDADTCLEEDGLSKIREAFVADPGLDCLIGAYDDQPAAAGTVSQFRNLLHCHIHRTARREATTFWSGCGAIRREIFFASNGFDERYRRPSIEDLELGARLHRAGRRMAMRADIRAKHLKRWTLRSMLCTDICDRAIPWTELILRERSMPDDLNVGMTQRLSVLLVFLFLASAASSFCASALWRSAAWTAGFTCLVAVLALNSTFYAFLHERRGPWFTMQAAALHLLFYLYNGLAFLVGVAFWATRSRQRVDARRGLTNVFAE